MMTTFRFLVLASLMVGAMPLRAIVPNADEVEIANLARDHPGQNRAEMVFDPILSMVARARALDLAARGYTEHVDPDGYGPNKWATLAGYVFPSWYGQGLDTNYIESLAAGYASASAVFEGWMNSPGHRTHLLGEDSFFADQTRYGVGFVYVPGSQYGWYSIFITAPPNQAGDQSLEPYAEWKFSHFTAMQIDVVDDLHDHDGDGIPRVTEFALDFDPHEAELMPAPVLDRPGGALTWDLPLRSDLGSVLAEVTRSGDGEEWTAVGVQEDGNTFSIPTTGAVGLMRLEVTGP